MLLEQSADRASAPRFMAIIASTLLATVALLANAGRIAETPVGAMIPGGALIGPAKLGQLRAIQYDTQGRLPGGMEARARAALAVAPLAYEPFLVAAAEGFSDPRAPGTADDIRYLHLALKRNARSVQARVFLMRHAVATGDLPGAIEQIAALNRLNVPIDRPMQGVGAAINTPKLVDEAVGALRSHPELFESFLRGFTGARKPRDIVVRMMTGLPREDLADGAIRRMAISDLVRVQAFGEARAIWGGSATPVATLHSPDFADTRGLPPFNWDLTTDETGAAERTNGGVALDYFGRIPGPLLSQLTTFPAGKYRAKLTYRSESGTSDALGLQIRCIGQAGYLVDQPLAVRPEVNVVLPVVFEVPAGCRGQMIMLAGRARETRESQQAIVRRLDIERLDQ